MAQSLDIYIDTTNGSLVAAGASRSGTLPTFTRNDSYNLRVRLQERDSNGFLRDIDTTGTSLKLGIGTIDSEPTAGEFKLVLNSVTSSAISFDATPTQVYNSISAIAGTGVAVTTFGVESGAYLITAMTANTAMSFGGDAFSLFPTSSVLVGTRRFPTASVKAQQVIRLVRNPAVFADTFAASSTAGVVALTKIQEGSSTKNETYDLAIGADAEGGSVIINFGTNSTTAIPIGSTAPCFNEALTAVTGIGSGNISVDVGNNAGNYSISFVRALGNTSITPDLTLDASGVIFAKFLTTTLTMGTAELDELFAENSSDTITPTLEVELTQNSSPKTILQTGISVRRDLITTGSAVPAAQAQYYTKAEVDAAFVEDSATNVDATNSKLVAGGQTSINYGSRTLNNSSGTQVVSYASGIAFANTPLGFYGTTVTARPANINVVSGLINVGLIASGTTYGVLPQSPRTLTAVTFFGPVTVGSNDVNSTTVSIVGVQPNDVCLLGLPAQITEGITFFSHCVTAGQVHVDMLNVTNSQKIQTATTYRITVIGY